VLLHCAVFSVANGRSSSAWRGLSVVLVVADTDDAGLGPDGTGLGWLQVRVCGKMSRDNAARRDAARRMRLHTDAGARAHTHNTHTRTQGRISMGSDAEDAARNQSPSRRQAGAKQHARECAKAHSAPGKWGRPSALDSRLPSRRDSRRASLSSCLGLCLLM
jgi:hypothetical protein